jgi:hypothetical protein
MQKYKILTILIFFFLIIPLGLLTNYEAWGEWDLSFFKEHLGYIPKGIESYHHIFNSLLPDYTFLPNNPIFSYYISAIIGVLTIFSIFYLIRQINK